MSFLDVDKRGRFQLFPDKGQEDIFHSLPTCRWRPGSVSMSLQPLATVYKGISKLIDQGELDDISDEAIELLAKLGNAYRDHRRAIKKAENRFKSEQFQEIPVPLKTNPFLHQVRAFGFATTLDASALIMEQGTGKTLTAIAVAAHRYLQHQVTRVLVICPKPVLPVWPRELRKHLSIPYQWDRVPKADTPIREMTEDGIQFLFINFDRVSNRFKDLKKWKADMIIIDEGHKIKNRSAKRAKACHKLGDMVKYKLLLTGTILGQQLTDAFSQMRFINCSVFGREWGPFRDQYCEMGGFRDKEIVSYKNLDHFSDRLHSVSFRCTKKECLDLPEETHQNLYCELSPKARKAYSELNRDLFTEIDGEEIEVELAITKLMKLRQITGGMVRNEEKIIPVSREKLSLLDEIVEDHDWSKKIAVFVSFTHELELIKDYCKKKKIGLLCLSGATSDDDRETLEERFREDDSIGMIAIQITTGAEGLDFTPANVGVFYSPTFSFMMYSQAKARIHRYGQDSPVTYINLVVEGTIDEDIVAFLEEYGDLSELILDRMRDYELTKGKTMGKITDQEDLEKACEEIKTALLSKGGKNNANNGNEEKPKPRRKKKMATAKNTKAKTKTASKKSADKAPVEKKVVAGYAAKDMAEELEIEPSELRALLRKTGIDKPDDGWKWKNKKAGSDVLKAVKALIKGAPAKKAAAEKPAKSKAKPAAKKAAAKSAAKEKAKPAKKAKAKSKKAAK